MAFGWDIAATTEANEEYFTACKMRMMVGKCGWGAGTLLFSMGNPCGAKVTLDIVAGGLTNNIVDPFKMIASRANATERDTTIAERGANVNASFLVSTQRSFASFA